MRIGGREIEMDAGRAVEGAIVSLRRRRLQATNPGRRKIARNPRDARGVGAVRRHGDVDDGIVEPGPARVRNANGRVIRELDDPFVIVAEFEFRRRAQHAVRTRRRG